ncbi:MAG: phenylacetate--CoA ligase family protein, partial [Armatimonadota bacterium]
RTRVAERQRAALESLLRALVPGNAFYAPRLAAAGLDAGIDSIDTFRNRMPFTTKAELVADQAAAPPFGTNLTFPLGSYTRISQTSGTSGFSLRWLDTPESWAWMVRNWARVFESAGIGAGDRIFFAFSFGPFLGFWTAFEAGAAVGALCIPGGGMSTELRLQALLGNAATVLCCTPTYALRLGDAARERGIDLAQSAVRSIVVAGEPGGAIPETRAAIESRWPGARVVDHHGMTEIGPVSYACPARPGVLHILEESFLVEVVDPETGAALPPGVWGELILTNLGRTGSPLLRYRTGDLVETEVAGRCVCGTFDIALPGGILGRTDDMVVVRGVNLWPAAVEAVVRRFPEVVEHVAVLGHRDAMAEVRVTIEPEEGGVDPDSLRERVEASLRTALGLRIPVEVAPPGTLPRYEFKARRWIRGGADGA